MATNNDVLAELPPSPGETLNLTLRNYYLRGRVLFDSDNLYAAGVAQRLAARMGMALTEFASDDPKKESDSLFNFHVKAVTLANHFHRLLKVVNSIYFEGNDEELPQEFNDKTLFLSANMLTLFMHPYGRPYAEGLPTEGVDALTDLVAGFGHEANVDQQSLVLFTTAMSNIVAFWDDMERKWAMTGEMDYDSISSWIDNLCDRLATLPHANRRAAMLVLMDAVRKTMGYIYTLLHPAANTLAAEGVELHHISADGLERADRQGATVEWLRSSVQNRMAIAAGRHAKWISWNGGLPATWTPKELDNLSQEGNGSPLFSWRGSLILVWTTDTKLLDNLQLIERQFECTSLGGLGFSSAGVFDYEDDPA